MKKTQTTKEQIILAHKYNIPQEQAWTINPHKVRIYERNPQVKLDKFLDSLDERRFKSLEKQGKVAEGFKFFLKSMSNGSRE